MILGLILIAPTVWILYFWYKRRNMYRLAAKIPAIKGSSSFIGIAHRLVGDNESKFFFYIVIKRKVNISVYKESKTVKICYNINLNDNKD